MTLISLGVPGCLPLSWGTSALLHPARTIAARTPERGYSVVDLKGEGVRLKGWLFPGEGVKRGTIVYLHGIGDNRASSIAVASHFSPQGFDVLAYDGRAHGESGGEACTYGYHEKRDLQRVLDQIRIKPIILLGVSLGGAIALQSAAEDRRIAAVIAVASFSNLRTVVDERAPFFVAGKHIAEVLRKAEGLAHFRVDDVNPAAAAARISVPVLLIHGERDLETPALHSWRIYAKIRAPKRLILLPDAGHTDCLTSSTWGQIDDWLGKSVGDELAAARKTGPNRTTIGRSPAGPSRQ